VGCAAILIQGIETYEWNAEMYGALASVSNIASAVKRKANVIRIAYSLNKINKQLGSMFERVDGVIEGRIPCDPAAEPVTEQRAHEMANDLTRLHYSIEYLYEQLRRAGLTNNSVTAALLGRLRKHGEPILDLADWIEASIDTKEASAIFERAAHEREHGELFSLEQVM
jgi:hypothetical protein